jgi:hypothetical protein
MRLTDLIRAKQILRGNAELLMSGSNSLNGTRLPTTSHLSFRTFLEILLWFAFQRLANREREDGTLIFRVRRKEVSHVVVEEGRPVEPRRWA